MSYQIYDFKKDIDLHINKKIPIDLKNRNNTFKFYLFNLKVFDLNKRITKSNKIFQEDYFLFNRNNKIYVAKKIENEKFDYILVKKGLKYLRKLKLNKIFR